MYEPRVDEKDFQAVLHEGRSLQSLQIVQLAMASGVLILAGAVLVLHLTGASRSAAPALPERDLVWPLTLAHAAAALGLWALALLIPALFLRPARLFRSGPSSVRPSSDIPGRERRCLDAFRGAFILRVALLEAPALFGLVLCLLASMSGRLEEQPAYWLNGLSAVVFLLFVAVSFPTRHRVMEWFRRLERRARGLD